MVNHKPGLKVTCAEDCGNSPKKALLRDLHVDLWGNEGRILLAALHGRVTWRRADGERVAGKDAVYGRMRMERCPDLRGMPEELAIHDIITHGRTAALNATITMGDGSRLEYCDVYRFAGVARTAPITEITSYTAA